MSDDVLDVELTREIGRMCDSASARAILIDYTNHRGERRERRILPVRIWWGKTEHHIHEQWLMDAYDMEKGEHRDFAMRYIHSWKYPEV